MIGREFDHPRKVIILVQDAQGLQHGFEIDNPRRAGWELIDVVDADGRSTGRVTVEGAMYRTSIDPGEQAAFDRIAASRPALNQGHLELEQ